MESGSFKWVCDKAAGIGIAVNDSNERSAAGIESVSDSESEGEVESDSKPETASDPPSKEAHAQVQVTATLFS